MRKEKTFSIFKKMDREWRVSVDLSQVDGMRTRMMGMSNAEVPRPALPSDSEGKISLKDVEEPVATVLQKAAELYKTFDKPLLEGYANVADFVKQFVMSKRFVV